jgi:hypothetical protein
VTPELEKELRRYLRNGKSQLIRRPTEDQKDYIQRVIGYRTEACVACNSAFDAGASVEALDYLRAEHDWALATIEAAGIYFDRPNEPKGEQLGLDF